MKRALITGITGQDGSYLAELLLSKGYEVHGLTRSSSPLNSTAPISNKCDTETNNKAILHYVDLADAFNLTELLENIRPDEIYNLAAQSHVRVSFDAPEYTADVTGIGTLRILEAVRKAGLLHHARFYQASSSEMYGKVQESPQSEATPFHPRSPYACAKIFAYYSTLNYRESHKLHASNGILFNHESPRRGETFVTRKITRAATRIKLGLQDKLVLGNLDAKRDWGYAPDYVEAMWLMLQQDNPDDYVIATGKTHSIREFCQEAFGLLDLDWEKYVDYDPQLRRLTEVDLIQGDSSKAKRVLGWEPRTSFKNLVHLMIKSDLALAKTELANQENDSVLTKQ
ncbi:MAG: GDP-mannose 4,6-dehydratase [Verrucomicrobia bacterium CG_4_10_14_3_um_filter_43_23]|nr:MAG: GDP-mannose 4,6-dehydratase [Verrucomicrobia bacterium CG1_02_43_26]PIP58979.1 MAG: GDP-mannose 4,6-dehydratase [Verrucomicrobia bacterium CG22_combo_CG10-13_8_21_14_all_43_17]PIX59077.1 MAG: GDP-mannose 4,6-dehydratase [Verrucomicrobia bacterium CG_4_10_14_3_um_filter_43_23]PIY61401.1 MAG: GDP-mannose 4,6-dehydratase [Verrucomicrobia bacterium CG_4_10_14_0_8_um_filter_43_34]PJA44183.1 MAG: GDP-mannose 4,6-dehydratase [Verrucomicrobia bacterium CG_4_9_14_3_um_filter_43_20]